MDSTFKISESKIVRAGWLPSPQDMRDYTEEHPEISKLINTLALPFLKNLITLPSQIDLRPWCSPIKDQGSLGACTAHAVSGIIEYFDRRAHNRNSNVSCLFIYKNTRLLSKTSRTGVCFRQTMGALTLLGAPAERYWPYIDQEPFYENDPPAFVYSLAANYKALKYFCHDAQGENKSPEDILGSVKTYLAFGIPSMFGFFGFPTWNQSDVAGGFPYPGANEKVKWGHAVVAVGYDDNKKIKNLKYGTETKGALLVRNSWGIDWGKKGYGWLPYDYILKKFSDDYNRLALDFWSLISKNWIDTNQFGIQS